MYEITKAFMQETNETCNVISLRSGIEYERLNKGGIVTGTMDED